MTPAYTLPRSLRATPMTAAVRGALIALLTITASQGLPPKTAWAAEPGATDSERQRYDIAHGPLDETLARFAARASINITMPPNLVADKRSGGLKGEYTIAQALKQLLVGTGLDAVGSGKSYVLKQLPQIGGDTGEATLAPVTVSAKVNRDGTTENTGSYTQRGSSNTATGLAMTMRETPQSISVITRQRMDDQNLTSVGEILDQTPGISRTQYGLAGAGYAYLYSRGFAIENYQIDGVLTPASALQGLSASIVSLNSAIYDHIEIVRGATGLLTGAGDPSATVNLLRKRPSSEFQAYATVAAGSWECYRTEVDVGGPLNEAGTLRGRLVAANDQGNTWIDRYHSESTTLYGVAELDLDDSTQLTLGFDTFKGRYDGGTQNGFSMLDSNDNKTNISRTANAGASWAYNDVQRYNLFASLQKNFANGWQANLSVSHSKTETDEMLGYVDGTIDASTGAADTYIGHYTWSPEQNAVDLRLSGPYQLFGREHELLLGLNFYTIKRQDPAYEQVWGNPVSNAYTFDGNIAHPDLARVGTDSLNTRQLGIYLATRLRPTDKLSVILGSRVTNWSNHAITQSSEQDLQESGVVTPYAGVVYDLNKQLSTYASYASIFNPQSYQDRNGQTLKPEEGTNYELGLKGEFFDKRLNASAAVFEVVKDNLAVRDGDALTPSGNDAYRAESNTKARGYELEISGEIMPDLKVAGGFTQVVTRDSDGARINTELPKRQFKLFTSYRLPGALRRLTIGGSVTWQSEIHYTDSAARRQDAYSLIGLMVRYQASDKLSFMLNAENLGDKTYLVNAWNHSYGAPRNFMVTAKYDF
jgi:outer membrane receptor for ferric coprogen and ferric-rhodotorulic acid